MPSSTPTINLLDINVWLAIAFASRNEHPVASAWFATQPPDSCCFCRYTQKGFLRLITNPKVMGPDVKTNFEAWRVYDQLRADPRVSFIIKEPPQLDVAWRIYSQSGFHAHNLWNDAFLAAFGHQSGFEVVTFDTGFRQFSGLACTIL